jgi:hypothetical protein
VAAAVCLLSLGCASKKPVNVPPDLSGLERADALVLQGCYDCLLDAHAVYRRISLGAGRPVVLSRLFETSVLLGLRHKELALDPSRYFDEARGLIKELPPEIDGARYLALADAVPPDDVGTPRRTLAAFRKAQTDSGLVAKIDDEVAWLGTAPAPAAPATTGMTTLSEPFRQYLGFALDCSYAFRARTAGTPVRPRGVRQPPQGAPPLVAFRVANCEQLNQPVLYRLRSNNPSFIEASLLLARFDLAVIDQMGPGQAGPRLDESRARFPASPQANYLSGSFNQSIGDCEAALAFYDETLALAPIHESAMLGRTICLTYLKRSDEAIESATRLINFESEMVGDGYYWRAWNRHARKELEPARADVERAKALKRNHPDVLTLAGQIEYDQDDLDPSKADLTAARQLSQGDMNCTAIWYLALGQVKRQDSPGAARLFEDAIGCYERGIAVAGLEIQRLEHTPNLDPAFKARRIASLKDAIQTATSQRFASALNAANYYAVASNIAAAKRLVEIAAGDPALAEKVNKLKEWLKDK